LLTVFIRHKDQSHRPVQVLSTLCQMILAANYISVLYLDVVGFRGTQVPVLITIVLMRIV
jgi:hypothetical protein